MVKVIIPYGLGIGCHQDAKHAYELAKADVQLVHINALLSGAKSIFESDILNLSGGFLHGDLLGAGMCAANQIEHAVHDSGARFKDLLVRYADSGRIIYGQCNGFQLLVKTGLLPGIANDYSKQTVTLTNNDCGSYRVAPVQHKLERQHFAFEGIDDKDLLLWCRHGEGKLQFSSEYGTIPAAAGEIVRGAVNDRHVLMRYVHPVSMEPTAEFPHNPNGSIDGIAGLANVSGHVFAQMAHPEVSVHSSRDARWQEMKDALRRFGVRAAMLDETNLRGAGLKIFENIVGYAKRSL
jgi:phosphoribosylformylglycinamidine synthase subunit PurQ / glutaminase